MLTNPIKVEKALNNYVFVKRLEKPKANSIIQLPTSMYISSNWVEVLHVPDTVMDPITKRTVSPEVKAGDTAFVRPSDGEKLDVYKTMEAVKYGNIEVVWNGSREELMERANFI